MGQYYGIANLSKGQALEKLNASKLMEFGYVASDDNINLVSLLSKEWKGDVVVVVGDYFGLDCQFLDLIQVQGLDPIQKQELARGTKTLYEIVWDLEKVLPKTEDIRHVIEDSPGGWESFWSFYEDKRFFVNYKRREYLDLVGWIRLHKTKFRPYKFHIESPVVLLLACGNGLGSGDYEGINEDKVGMWAFDPVGIERERPGEDFTDITEKVLFRG